MCAKISQQNITYFLCHFFYKTLEKSDIQRKFHISFPNKLEVQSSDKRKNYIPRNKNEKKYILRNSSANGLYRY